MKEKTIVDNSPDIGCVPLLRIAANEVVLSYAYVMFEGFYFICHLTALYRFSLELFLNPNLCHATEKPKMAMVIF